MGPMNLAGKLSPPKVVPTEPNRNWLVVYGITKKRLLQPATTNLRYKIASDDQSRVARLLLIMGIFFGLSLPHVVSRWFEEYS